MSLIYAAEADALRARDRAFTLDEARRATSGDPANKLRWMMTAVDDSYAPYLVKLHAIDGSRATISFVHCRTGEVMKHRVEIDLADRELVWDRLPSTLEGWSPGTTDCAFLFLSAKIHDLTADAAGSGGGTGKWPRAAAVTTSYEELRELTRELLDDPAILERLPAHKRALLARLLGEAGR